MTRIRNQLDVVIKSQHSPYSVDMYVAMTLATKESRFFSPLDILYGLFEQYLSKHSVLPSGVLFKNEGEISQLHAETQEELKSWMDEMDHSLIQHYSDIFMDDPDNMVSYKPYFFQIIKPQPQNLVIWLNKLTKPTSFLTNRSNKSGQITLNNSDQLFTFPGCNDNMTHNDLAKFFNDSARLFSQKKTFTIKFLTNKRKATLRETWPFKLLSSFCIEDLQMLRPILPKAMLTDFCSVSYCTELYGYSPKAKAVITAKNGTVGLNRTSHACLLLREANDISRIISEIRLFSASEYLDTITIFKQTPINNADARIIFEFANL